MGPRCRQLRTMAYLVLAGSVLTATEAGFPSHAQGDDWSHLALPPGIVEKPAVSWMLSPNCDARPVGAAIDMIVIHDTETPGIRDARTIWRHFATPLSHVSAHYIIGKAGEIVQCVPDELRAWHCGESYFEGRDHLNDTAIGIELVNAQTGTDPFTAPQYHSLVKLVSYLVAEYHVPPDRIVGHKDITLKPDLKRDPAPNFSWSRFMSGVDETLAEANVREARMDPPSP